MSTVDVVRAWKDERYRLSLSAEKRAILPPNPAGTVELRKEDLAPARGEVANSGEDCLDTRLICSLIFGCFPWPMKDG